MTDEGEHPSLEYIEDPYFNPQDSTLTPSLDDLDDSDILEEYDLLESENDIFDLRQLDFDEVTTSGINIDEALNVETEFFNVKRANAIVRTFFRNKVTRQVRVRYSDLTKPYLAKLPKDNSFRKYLHVSLSNSEEAMAADHVAPDLSHLSQEEKEQQEKIWREELAQVEDEIVTLRTVLASKMRRSAELKKNLGITFLKEVSDDINQGIKNVKESNVYQTVENKVEQVAKAVSEAPLYQKTTSVIGGFTSNITSKLGQMRHSESFKSIEERVGSAYENVKGKVISRSGSQQSVNEEARSRSGSVATSPTIPEEKPVA
ncbi:tumor protein D52 isoform X1 [Anthonomus grandis grandis]|uniref:tumor protein D52 isoform X1 n=2 Tax=Anthonomus grandis grandis TaxID=2921223 RepID=UPI002166A5B2|nr:tumor protein D52 isoform X1 [Anthonomus grandis grandis]